MAVWKVDLTILDSKGETAPYTFYLPFQTWTTAYALAKTPFDFLYEAATYLDVLIDGAIVDCTMTLNVGVPAPFVKQFPNPDADVESSARIQWRTQNNHYFRHRIPTFREAYVLPGSNYVDTSDPDFLAIRTLLLGNSIPSYGYQATDSRGENLAGLVWAKEHFKPRK